eukprot:gene216-393_t
MFRESDFEYPKPHPTYGKKPVSILQKATQQTKFNAFLENENHDHLEILEPEIVPTTFDTKYDPQDPKADWAGYVSRNEAEKRHRADHISQQVSLERTEFGISSATENHEWPRVKRDFAPMNHRSGDLIGGISANPDDAYLTSYQRQINGEATNITQMSMQKQVAPRRHVQNPCEVVPHNRSSIDQMSQQQSIDSVAMQRARPIVGQSKSLLSNLGASLLDSVPDAPRSSSTADKQSIQSIPGYTGYRTKQRPN